MRLHVIPAGRRRNWKKMKKTEKIISPGDGPLGRPGARGRGGGADQADPVARAALDHHVDGADLGAETDQAPTIKHQRSSINDHVSSINHQASSINEQAPSTNDQASTFKHQASMIKNQAPSIKP